MPLELTMNMTTMMIQSSNGYFPVVVVDEDHRWNNDTLEIVVIMRLALLMLMVLANV
jgi:hypothetical protein